MDIHLEFRWLNVRKSYNPLSFFQPTGRTSSAKEFRFCAYHIFVDSETVFIRSNKDPDYGLMVVARSRSTSCMADILSSANLGRFEARSPEELLDSNGRFTELSPAMESDK